MTEQIIDLGEQNRISDKPRCGMATASLICSLVLCCPIVTLVGVILGIVALMKIRGSAMSGRGLAWAGIIVGILTTTLTTLFLIISIKVGLGVVEQTPESVTTAIKAGITGDTEKFRMEFIHDAIAASDDEITIFLETISTRYGVFDEAVIDMATFQAGQQPSIGEGEELPIQLVFETKTISAIAVYTYTVEVGTESLIDVQIQCLLIYDPENGDIAFPLASQCGSSVSETDTKTDEK
jgi:hypothetical protein